MEPTEIFAFDGVYKLTTTSRFTYTTSLSMATGVVALLLLLFLNVRCSDAQVSSDNRNDNYRYYYGRFSPTLAVVVVVIAATFFFFALFAVFRRCSGRNDLASNFFLGATGGEGGESLSRGLGLSPEAMEKLSIVKYEEAKGMKGGLLPMDCAVCLSEFEDDDELVRLLPRCGHLFHAYCITAWLASHVTCPVCRDNLAQLTAETTTAGAPQENVAIVVGEAEEAVELERLGRQRQEARSGSRSSSGRRPQTWFPRSHSTSHSVTARPMPDMDVYRFVIAERNQGPSVFLRSLSASLPAWASRRRGVEEGENSRGGRSAAAALDQGSSSTSFPPSQA